MVKPVDVKTFKAPAPRWDRNEMYYLADSYDWIFEPLDPFTKAQIIVPGFFNNYYQEFRVGSRITARLGPVEDGITEVELQVIDLPGKGGRGDVVVSVGASRKFTPVRHSEGSAEDKEQVA